MFQLAVSFSFVKSTSVLESTSCLQFTYSSTVLLALLNNDMLSIKQDKIAMQMHVPKKLNSSC